MSAVPDELVVRDILICGRHRCCDLCGRPTEKGLEGVWHVDVPPHGFACAYCCCMPCTKHAKSQERLDAELRRKHGLPPKEE